MSNVAPVDLSYTCKLSALHPPMSVRLTSDALQLLDDNGVETRRVPLRSIRRITRFDGMKAEDPAGVPYQVEFAKVNASGCAPVRLRNGVHVGSTGSFSDVAIDQSSAFDAFILELIERATVASPSATVIRGSAATSLAWWGVALIGVALAVFGVAAFWYDTIWTAIAIASIAIPVGVLLTFLGVGLACSHWPRRLVPG